MKVKKMSSRRKRSRKDKIKQKKKDERNLMNEKHQKNIRKRSSFSKYGRVKERSKNGAKTN